MNMLTSSILSAVSGQIGSAQQLVSRNVKDR